ncbi:MAG: BBP7 family outer membrane beta-barrel protein [Planctomycetes bacterium]|nr:BBP7 family outer membrane beta-barrel protein [Planctomycetota bacterium]
MRAAFLSCSLCVLTAAQAMAQSPPATLPPTTAPTTPAVTTAPALPTSSEVILSEVTGQESRSGRPFAMVGPRAYAAADYMLFWYTPMNCPTLVQTIPSVLVNDPAAVAATNFPTKSQVHYDGVSGIRLNGGVNFDKTGIDFGGFLLNERTLTTSLANNGTPVFIGRPFIDSTTGQPTTLNISNPNQYIGGVRSEITSQMFGFEVNAKRSWYTLLADATYLIGGFRYFDLQESIAVNSLSVFPTGDSVRIADSVRTHNSFYGGQIGFTSVIGGFAPGFGASFTTKSGIGGVNQRVDLVGSNTILQAGTLTQESGGLFARGLNAGSFSRGQFAYMQDLDIKLTYNFTCAFQVSFGYSLFYISSMVRPGDQVDPVINPNQIRFTNGGMPSVVGPQPAFQWHAHSFVVQGLTFGARLAY